MRRFRLMPPFRTAALAACATLTAVILATSATGWRHAAAVPGLPAAVHGLPAAAPASQQQVARSPHGMVVSGSPIASSIGAAVLEQGGNAVDAAVAMAFTLSVVEPSMSGIGGRTQILLRTAAGEFAGIDGTTEVPAAYPYGAVAADDDAYGYATVAIPGTVAALAAALERYGTLPLASALEPAIRLADDGFPLPADEAQRIAGAAAQLAEFDGARRYFLRDDGAPYAAGDLFVQRDLARTLRIIAAEGARGFYHGSIARRMEEDVRHHGGWLTAADLASYQAEPALLVHGSYRGYDMTATYLPASGATTIQVMHILENFDLGSSVGSAEWAALVASALLLGFADRGADLGTREQKAETLTSKAFAARRARDIRVPRNSPPPRWLIELEAELELEPEPAHTTHLSVADARGGVVALTQSVGPNMGSKVAAPGLGFVYAATMGYLGSMQPGARPLSSQSPIIVHRDGNIAYVAGAAGARRIISALVLALSRAIDEQLPLHEALAAPRLHATPTAIDMEVRPGTAWSGAQLERLGTLGFAARQRSDAPYFARINAIAYETATGMFTGVADPRWAGAAIAPARTPLELKPAPPPHR
jgi:gamma-glutamyltranspeptidase / glutathione hydrolase